MQFRHTSEQNSKIKLKLNRESETALRSDPDKINHTINPSINFKVELESHPAGISLKRN